MSRCPVRRLELAVELDARPVARRIGLIALATDHTSERDFARICPHREVAVYTTRIGYDNPTTPASLRRTGPRLAEAAARILPGEELDACVFACTAASALLGEAAIAAAVHAAKPGAACVTPVGAACAALAVLGSSAISVLAPYTTALTGELVEAFEAAGVEVVSAVCLGLEDDREMARVSPGWICEAAVRAADRRAEALFVSCTALRAAEVAAAIEARIARPVVTSNQAMIWRALRAAGWVGRLAGHGRLLEAH